MPQNRMGATATAPSPALKVCTGRDGYVEIYGFNETPSGDCRPVEASRDMVQENLAKLSRAELLEQVTRLCLPLP